jgi:hypothetical protein
MSGALDGGLQATLGQAFSGLFLEARHYRKDFTRSTNGDVSRAVIRVQPLKAQRDSSFVARREGDGFTDTTGRLIVLQTYEGRAVDPIAEGEEIRLQGIKWKIGNVTADPANSHWFVEVARG